MRTIEKLTTRELQVLAARALSAMEATSSNIYKFNKQAHHNSQNWYKAVINWYIEEYDGWPDETGPGTEVQLIADKL